ncbi:hypothetical protein SGRIM128S_05437 [Streptomyces griseomycini]
MTQPASVASAAYLRFPHLHGELVAFTAEDDVWLAPLDGGRAWRVSADNVPVNHPRISPDGTTVAWTSTRDGAPEVHVAPVAEWRPMFDETGRTCGTTSGGRT